MDAIVAASRNGLTSALENAANITLYRGHARFASPQAVEIEGERLRAGRIFINVGGRALAPPMPGINEVPYLTNSSMMDVDFLPHHLIIVGGSYIGLEFGQMYRRFGSRVTIIEMAPRLVRHEDEDVSAAIKDIVEREGVEVRLNAECISLAKRGDEIVAKVDCTVGAPEVAGSHLLLAVGRRPNTDDLDLDKAGVRCDERGYIVVDGELQTRRRASGRSATATARAPSPTPRTTISRSSRRICSTTTRAGSASGSPHMPFTPTRHWAAWA
jgi:pyruvate/2-oxoglutarate dehydrogenase complex dihydrolipoamide dehydrogenase (E3) component